MSNGGRTQYRWCQWPCRYSKQFYDIEIIGKDIILGCWPNANTFHSPNGTIYESTQIRKIRKSKKE